MMKTGVLVHGCNLHAENWRHLAWGDPPIAMGRLPQGLLTAHTHKAEVIVFGSGASSKEYRCPSSPKVGCELLESEYTYEYLVSHFDKLLNFKPWQQEVARHMTTRQWQEFEESMLSRIVLDKTSQNTVEELATAGEIFVERGIEQVYLISSPTHIVRVLRDANKVFQQDFQFRSFMHHVSAVPCMTCYEGAKPSDVVVIEPPHRPDRHVLPTHRRIQRMLALQKLEPDDLMNFINDFDELLQQYEEVYFNGRCPPVFLDDVRVETRKQPRRPELPQEESLVREEQSTLPLQGVSPLIPADLLQSPPNAALG